MGKAFAGDIPDLAKTPGLTRTGLSKAKICSIKWGKDERHVTAAMKRQVFELYGYSGYDDPRCVPDSHGRRCEVDHLIGRELGVPVTHRAIFLNQLISIPYSANIFRECSISSAVSV